MECTAKKVFISGGTGFVGSALTQALVKKGASVYILTRDTSKQNVSHVNYIFSIYDIEKIQPDVIINLAGETISKRWTKYNKKEIKESRVKITNQLVDYIKHAQKKPQIFISGSAIGYYGTDPSYHFLEDSIPLGRENSFAAEVCQAWENAAQPASDYLRLVLLRIGVVLEKHGGMLRKLLPIFRLGLGGPMGNGKQWISWIGLDDLIQVILFCIQNDAIHGPVNATAPEPVTNLQFVTELASVLKRPAMLHVPGFLVSMMSGQMGEELILNGQYVVPNKLVEAKFTFNCPTLARALSKIFKRR